VLRQRNYALTLGVQKTHNACCQLPEPSPHEKTACSTPSASYTRRRAYEPTINSMNKDNKENLQKLIAKLDTGGNVSVRDLRNTLGDDAAEEYESRWAAELERRSTFDTKPASVKRYEDLLKKADFLELRANKNKQGKRSKRDIHGRDSNTRLRQQAEKVYEQAVAFLEGEVATDSSLHIWFDRQLIFGPEGRSGLMY